MTKIIKIVGAGLGLLAAGIVLVILINLNVNIGGRQQNITVGTFVSVARDEIVTLPTAQRELGLQVLDTLETLGRDDSGPGSTAEQAAQRFRSILEEIAVLSYDHDSNPLPLQKDRAVLLCNGTFSVVYTGLNSGGSLRIVINGSLRTMHRGGRVGLRAGQSSLSLQWLQYLQPDDLPIMHFECA
jgi:hypothetical protein